jgi:hypothetical protein
VMDKDKASSMIDSTLSRLEAEKGRSATDERGNCGSRKGDMDSELELDRGQIMQLSFEVVEREEDVMMIVDGIFEIYFVVALGLMRSLHYSKGSPAFYGISSRTS